MTYPRKETGLTGHLPVRDTVAAFHQHRLKLPFAPVGQAERSPPVKHGILEAGQLGKHVWTFKHSLPDGGSTFLARTSNSSSSASSTAPSRRIKSSGRRHHTKTPGSTSAFPKTGSSLASTWMASTLACWQASSRSTRIPPSGSVCWRPGA
jgi:hypothetical protein